MAAKYPRDLALHLSDDEGEFQIECLILPKMDRTFVPYLNMAVLNSRSDCFFVGASETRTDVARSRELSEKSK